jgi:adenosylcobyric acid synthase
MPVLMVQGTASHAGKSTLVAALCRIFAQDGYRVAPFKAQNMSLNAAVTPDGGEIGRAQYTQALAARVAPSVDMNPILLKPTDGRRSQIIVRGRVLNAARGTVTAADGGAVSAADYYARATTLWPIVTESLDRLRGAHDIVVIEGAGSPAEINLSPFEIVNMRVARYAHAPVLLVGDIERGGVFAALYGTAMLLPPEERALIRGFVINKFRGDPTILGSGFESLLAMTGIPTLGVLPYLPNIDLPEEDALGLPTTASDGHSVPPIIDVAVVRYPHLSNFDDLDPLRRDSGVHVRWIEHAADLGAPDLIILPGTKTTVADLAWLRARGLDAAILARRAAGAAVIGICGGFQMLGTRIDDPLAVESDTPSTPGLGVLPVTTTFAADKRTRPIAQPVTTHPGLLARAGHTMVHGYEIHMGVTQGLTTTEPFTLDATGRTMGCYFHGLFVADDFRRALLDEIASWKGLTLPPSHRVDPDKAFDALADVVRTHLDMTAVRGMLQC